MDQDAIASVLDGGIDDEMGLRWKFHAMVWSGNIGLGLLWIAAALTLMTGFDYFSKSLPF